MEDETLSSNKKRVSFAEDKNKLHFIPSENKGRSVKEKEGTNKKRRVSILSADTTPIPFQFPVRPPSPAKEISLRDAVLFFKRELEVLVARVSLLGQSTEGTTFTPSRIDPKKIEEARAFLSALVPFDEWILNDPVSFAYNACDDSYFIVKYQMLSEDTGVEYEFQLYGMYYTPDGRIGCLGFDWVKSGIKKISLD